MPMAILFSHRFFIRYLLHPPLQINPAGNEGGYRSRDRGIREEQTGEETLLDLLHLDGRAGPSLSRGPGNSSADCRTDYWDGGILQHFSRYTFCIISMLARFEGIRERRS